MLAEFTKNISKWTAHVHVQLVWLLYPSANWLADSNPNIPVNTGSALG
jgi:hypothetical protein